MKLCVAKKIIEVLLLVFHIVFAKLKKSVYICGGETSRRAVKQIAATSFFLSSDTESINFDHHLRCGWWPNFEFSKREIHSGWAIKTIYRKLNRGMLKHIPLNQ